MKGLVVRLPEMWGVNVTNMAFAPVFENTLNGNPIPWLLAAQRCQK
jgi:hypothetical protein